MEIVRATQEHRQPVEERSEDADADRSRGDSGASTGDGENEGIGEVQA